MTLLPAGSWVNQIITCRVQKSVSVNVFEYLLLIYFRRKADKDLIICGVALVVAAFAAFGRVLDADNPPEWRF